MVKDPDVKAQLATQYRRAWKIYRTLGERTVELDDGMRKVLEAVQWQVDHFEEIPVMVVPCLVSSLRGASACRSCPRRRWPRRRSTGRSSRRCRTCCWRPGRWAWGPRSSRCRCGTARRRILGLPLSVTPACVVPLGWPKGRYGPTTRRPVGDVVHLDRYGSPFSA